MYVWSGKDLKYSYILKEHRCNIVVILTLLDYTQFQGAGRSCDSVVEGLSSMHKSLDYITSTTE